MGRGEGGHMRRGNLLVSMKFHGCMPPAPILPKRARTTVTGVKTTASGPPVCPSPAGTVRNLLCRKIPLATPGGQQHDPAVWGFGRKQQMRKAKVRLKESLRATHCSRPRGTDSYPALPSAALPPIWAAPKIKLLDSANGAAINPVPATKFNPGRSESKKLC